MNKRKIRRERKQNHNCRQLSMKKNNNNRTEKNNVDNNDDVDSNNNNSNQPLSLAFHLGQGIVMISVILKEVPGERISVKHHM
jgi:hypothetical protein